MARMSRWLRDQAVGLRATHRCPMARYKMAQAVSRAAPAERVAGRAEFGADGCPGDD